jgi:hypothetical protein
MRSLTIAFNSAISAAKPNQLFGNYRVPRHIGATCRYLGLGRNGRIFSFSRSSDTPELFVHIPGCL